MPHPPLAWPRPRSLCGWWRPVLARVSAPAHLHHTPAVTSLRHHSHLVTRHLPQVLLNPHSVQVRADIAIGELLL